MTVKNWHTLYLLFVHTFIKHYNSNIKAKKNRFLLRNPRNRKREACSSIVEVMLGRGKQENRSIKSFSWGKTHTQEQNVSNFKWTWDGERYFSCLMRRESEIFLSHSLSLSLFLSGKQHNFSHNFSWKRKSSLKMH